MFYIVSKLRNHGNSTSDCVSFSTENQHYFNFDPQHWNSVDPTLIRRWNVGCEVLLKITYSLKNSLSSDKQQCFFNLGTIANLPTVTCQFCLKVRYFFFVYCIALTIDLIHGFRDLVPGRKMPTFYQHTQTFRATFCSYRSYTRRLQFIDVNNQHQTVFERVYTVYTYWNCMIYQLTYCLQTM